MNRKIIKLTDHNGKEEIIAIIDPQKLHRFILDKVSNELNQLVEDCYYPKISNLFKDIYYLTHTDEKKLTVYSRKLYGDRKWNILHNPKTTVLVLITQEFLRNKDVAAAQATFHLFSLMYYTNLMHKFIKYCNKDYFRTALNNLSHNHLFVSKRTIASSIIYLSKAVYARYADDIVDNDPDRMAKMIQELRSRFNQSVRSFANKYYEISKSKETIKSGEESDDRKEQEAFDKKLRTLVDTISKDICVYRRVNTKAVDQSVMITKFNKKISMEYAEEMATVEYIEDVQLAMYLLMKNIKDFNSVSSIKFIEYIQSLMAIKVSKKPMYFKKALTILHDKIVDSLGYSEWFNKLSIQSKSVSRKFLAYYIAFIIRSYF